MWSVFMIVIYLQSSKSNAPTAGKSSYHQTLAWWSGSGLLLGHAHPSFDLDTGTCFPTIIINFCTHLINPSSSSARPNATIATCSTRPYQTLPVHPLPDQLDPFLPPSISTSSSSSNILFVPVDPTEPHRIASIILTLTLVEFRPGHRSGHLPELLPIFPVA